VARGAQLAQRVHPVHDQVGFAVGFGQVAPAGEQRGIGAVRGLDHLLAQLGQSVQALGSVGDVVRAPARRVAGEATSGVGPALDRGGRLPARLHGLGREEGHGLEDLDVLDVAQHAAATGDVEAEALVAEPGDLAVHVHVQHELGTDVLDRLGGVPGGVDGGGTRVGGG